MFKLRSAVAVLAVTMGSTATADIINVGPGDSIQAAIADPGTVDGDEIVVAPGTYFETVDFIGKAITVRSTDPNDAGVVMHTIINGGGLGTVVTCDSGEGADTVLSGFVITGGNAVNGGGMRNDNSSSPTVTNCSFIGNTATNSGGGMQNNNGASPPVTNTGFCNNTPDQIFGDPIIDGGGNSLLYCPPPIPKPNPCPTDINGDGVTNVLDLIALLLAFGAVCP